MSDPRLDVYRNLKDRELARRGDLFIAEGEHLVRRLLASTLEAHSVLLAERRTAEMAPLVPTDVPVYSAPDDLMRQVLGFKFHSGVIACGRRPRNPTLEEILPRPDRNPSTPFTLLVCPQIINHDNLGSIIRIAAAFGVTALLLGERSCDPFWRRSVRVSMGAAFTLAIRRCQNLRADLLEIKSRGNVQLAATVLDQDAEPLARARRPDRLALLIGAEAQGLEPHWVSLCDRRITIPMQCADSLNVSVATAVFLHHFTQR